MIENFKTYKLGFKRDDKWIYQSIFATKEILTEIVKSHLEDETTTQISILKEN